MVYFGYILFFFGFLTLDVIFVTNGDSKLPVYHTDTCDETGRKAITCTEGHVIRIVDVRIMPKNYSCVQRDDVAKLCDGLNSCSFVDLRKQLFYYCKDKYKQVYTSFECVPSAVKPLCRTNICSEDNSSIKCRRGKVFHLLGAKCFSMGQECPREVFVRIYRSCEGERTCALSVLRAGIPQSICQEDLYRQRNLFMDYLCVAKSTVTSNCDIGTFVKQEPRFGILQNPGYPNNAAGNPKGCYWAIYTDPEQAEEVEVTVHEAFSVEGTHMCETQFLQVQYTLCDTRKLTVERFCDENRVNVRIRSCGTVYVTHYTFLAGEDRGNRFLLSYSVKSPSTSIEPYEQYADQCERVNQALLEFRYTLPQPSPTLSTEYNKPTTERPETPEDQLLNDSIRTDPEVEPPDEIKEDTDSFDPWRVVVVNIFLGLLIVALVMALTFVCYRSNFRYITIGREKKRETTTKSETATTLDADKQSTEMQLLPQDGAISATQSSGHLAQSRDNIDPETEPLQVQSSAYETTIFHFNRAQGESDDENMFCDNSTGVSSFLPHPPLRRSNGKQQNTESAYSSLDDEQADNGDYSEILDHHSVNKLPQDSQETNLSVVNESSRNSEQHYDVPKAIKTNNSTCCKAQLTKENSIDSERRRPSDQTNHTTLKQKPHNSFHHYQVNNVDYAVITKIPGQRISTPVQNHVNCPSPNTIETKAEVQQPHHIHTVPEDTCSLDHTSPTTMHLIPEHKCLIHKIPPPPPPPVKTPDWDSPSRTSCSATQADV